MNETFKPFDKVLVRDGNEKWALNMFSHYDETATRYPFICLIGCFKNCIPYEGNEALLGTANEYKPKRWRAESNGKYYIINALGGVQEDIEHYLKSDELYYNIGNYFRTKEEAEEIAVKFKAMLKGG